MRNRSFRMTLVVVAALAIAFGAFSTTTPADDGFEPFPCDVVCVPVPYFPFILCAPSCPLPPPPGP